jgi:hypothetical protein
LGAQVAGRLRGAEANSGGPRWAPGQGDPPQRQGGCKTRCISGSFQKGAGAHHGCSVTWNNERIAAESQPICNARMAVMAAVRLTCWLRYGCPPHPTVAPQAMRVRTSAGVGGAHHPVAWKELTGAHCMEVQAVCSFYDTVGLASRDELPDRRRRQACIIQKLSTSSKQCTTRCTSHTTLSAARQADRWTG